MSITAKVIADSVRENVDPNDRVAVGTARLTTLELRYPRLVHSEFMTHRVFSRNASSSRAIPVAKMIEQVEKDPYVPESFGANGKGMQPHGDLSEETYSVARERWLEAAHNAVNTARQLADLKVHKQHANRVLEPFSYITVIATSSRYQNFLTLRDNEMAQHEIAVLARKMRDALSQSTPSVLPAGKWHLPYIRDTERSQAPEIVLLRGSVARCARVSYNNHDGTVADLEKDADRHDALLKEQHFSPFEHQAQPNLVGLGDSNLGPYWRQYRKLLSTEWHCTL